MTGMSLRKLSAVSFVLLMACIVSAGQDRTEIASHLQNQFKIACLRNPAHGNNLSYDSDGNLRGSALPGAITNGGAIEINKLSINDKELEIRATRILFIENPLQAFRTAQALKVTIRLSGKEASEADFRMV